MKQLWLSAVCFCLTTIGWASQPLGHIDWSHHCGGSGRDSGQAMSGLPDGSFYVTGWFEGTYDRSLSLPPKTFGARDIFLSKYDSEGNLVWLQSAGSVDSDYGDAVDALPDGTCAITGSYGGSATFGYGQPNETVLSSSGETDIYIAKYDGDGTLLWARTAGGPSQDWGTSVALSPDGGLYITGQYDASTSIDFTKASQPTAPGGAGATIGFVARYDAQGAFQWAEDISCTKVITLADNSCVVADMNGLARYGLDGTLLWQDATLTTFGVNAVAAGGMEFVAAYQRDESSFAVNRYRVENNDAVTVIRSVILPDVSHSYLPPMSARPDGSLVVQTATALWNIEPDGTPSRSGLMSFYADGLFAIPGRDYCFMVARFEHSVNLSNQIYTDYGNGDFFIAKTTTHLRYVVSTSFEGAGWVDFHRTNNWYWPGEQATLTAVSVFPNAYQFVGWGGEFEGETDPTITFTVDGDKQVLARFELLEGASLPAASAWALVTLASLIALAATGARWTLMNPRR